MLLHGNRPARDCLTAAFGIILIFLFLTNLSSSAAALPPSDSAWANDAPGGISFTPQQAVDAFQDRLIVNALAGAHAGPMNAQPQQESVGGSILAVLQSKLGWFQGKLTSFLTHIWGGVTGGSSHTCR